MIIKYGLYHKEKNVLLNVEITDDTYGYESVIGFTLCADDYEETVWLHSNIEIAESARTHTAPNTIYSSYDRPVNPFNPEELEVVEVELSF